VDLYMKITAFADKLRKHPSKDEDLITIAELIRETEASDSPYASKTLNSLRSAETAILEDSFAKAAVFVGKAALDIKGGTAGAVGR
jgi:hypothetical protein